MLLFLLTALLAFLGVWYAERRAHAGMGLLAAYTILMNLFVGRQVSLLGWHASAAEPFAVALSLGFNLLRERHGAVAASHMVRACSWINVWVMLLSQILLRTEVCPGDATAPALELLLAPAPRIIVVSMLSFWLSNRFEVHCFGWLTRRWGRAPFSVRHAGAASLGQALDTCLFTWGALSGWVDNLGEIASIALAVKWATVVLSGLVMQAVQGRTPKEPGYASV